MIFLISRQKCEIVELNLCLLPDVKYKLSELENRFYTFFTFNAPTYINLHSVLAGKQHKNAVKVSYNGNDYIFLFFNEAANFNFYGAKINNKCYNICVFNNLTITEDGQTLLNTPCANISFSHYKTFNNFIILFFTGQRNYFVLIKDDKVLAHDYYDEINVDKNEIYLMTRLNDALNHGRVHHLTEEWESYLSYLDENELKLKDEMCFLTFLDCLKAQNYKYCNNLLTENLKQKNAPDIAKFFNEFDYFYPEQNLAFCFKKNALVGIYKFEVENGLIANIVLM